MGVSRYTDEDIAEAIRRVQEGEPKTKVAKDLCCSATLIGLWMRGKRNGKENAKPKSTPKAENGRKKRSADSMQKSETDAQSSDAESTTEDDARDSVDVIGLIEDLALPYGLGKVVEGCFELSQEDDFVVLERVEAAIARHRSSMEARAC